MDIQDALRFASDQHRGVLGTFRTDGMPSLTPVLLATDDDGFVVVSTRETAYKVGHVRRDPRVVGCMMTDQFFGDWVQFEGTATVQSLPGAMDGLIDYFRRTAGEHSDWDEYRRAMTQEQRCLLRIQLTRVGPNRRG